MMPFRHLSTKIIKYFLIPHFPDSLRADVLEGRGKHNHQRICISLEKPTAVMFADAPVVEVLVDSDPSKSEVVKALWESHTNAMQPPFPLQGTLATWETNVKLH
jgi:hypothetical protein